MTARYDAIVLGVGGVGSAALFHLARRGVRALGLDRFPPGHDRGSSHGDTRIIRLAYFEGPDYVPLLRRSYALWEELEGLAGRRLYEEVGLLEVGAPDGPIVPGVLASARAHGLEVEALAPDEVARRFGGAFALPEGARAVFERRAGFLHVEECVRAHAALAQAAGASLRTGEAVQGWAAEGDGVLVTTDRGRYAADRLIVTAGPWAGEVLEDLGLPLEVVRKPLLWFEAKDPRYARERGCPCFYFETAAGHFYGFPALPGAEGPALKVAEHSGGEPVADPLAVDRALRPADEAGVAAFLRAHLPGVGARRVRHAVCMYTRTPDEHFVVDRHPRHPQVVLAAGLSGHGFKMASGLGEALVDLALGDASSATAPFALARFGGGAG